MRYALGEAVSCGAMRLAALCLWAARGLVLALWCSRRCLAAPSRITRLCVAQRAEALGSLGAQADASLWPRRDHELSIPPIDACGAMRACSPRLA